MQTYALIHGLGQTAESWDGVLAHLPSDVRFHKIDLSKAAASPLDYGALCAALEAACGRMDAPLRLCGLSLGATLALQYAIDHPDRVASLVLVAAQYKSPKLLMGLQSAIFRLLPESAFRGMGFPKRDVLSLTDSMRDLDLSAALGGLRCPCWVACGERDRANRSAALRLARALPQAQLRLLRGAGHEANRDAPEALAALLREAWGLGD